MDEKHPLWRNWGSFLRRHSLNETAAVFLEAAGPLTILGAQMAYLLQPFFNPERAHQWQAVAELLEDPEQGRSFATFLRQEETQK
jgi:hypothetical protein